VEEELATAADARERDRDGMARAAEAAILGAIFGGSNKVHYSVPLSPPYPYLDSACQLITRRVIQKNDTSLLPTRLQPDPRSHVVSFGLLTFATTFFPYVSYLHSRHSRQPGRHARKRTQRVKIEAEIGHVASKRRTETRQCKTHHHPPRPLSNPRRGRQCPSLSQVWRLPRHRLRPTQRQQLKQRLSNPLHFVMSRLTLMARRAMLEFRQRAGRDHPRPKHRKARLPQSRRQSIQRDPLRR
jgi:hypothetical protein